MFERELEIESTRPWKQRRKEGIRTNPQNFPNEEVNKEQCFGEKINSVVEAYGNQSET